MIEFVTLLLGLVTGSQAVELSAGEQVALVEVRLDGRFAGGLTRPPWILNLDFGQELSPHELVATAYDGHRQELQTIRQWVNLPRQRVEARLALDRPAGRPATARLIWTALDHPDPPEVEVTFDGQPLPAVDLEAIELPAHDPRGVHFLRAELAFSTEGAADGTRAAGVPDVTHAELVFGGSFGDQVATEMTALVLVPTKGGKRNHKAGKRNHTSLPEPETMDGRLRKGDQDLRVVAVDRGPVNLLVVRERSAVTQDGLGRVFQDFYRKYHPPPRVALGLQGEKKPPTPTAVLGEGDRVRFAYPTAGREQVQVGQGAAPLLIEQVPVSHDVTDLGPLFDILTSAFSDEDEAPVARQQLADAVAIAGVVAATGDRRRAVLLIRSGVAEDSSRFSPATVRAYLRRLGVPLVVWSIAAEGEVSSVWGEARDVSRYEQLNKALDKLRKLLESQIVVWVEGAHLGHEIELTDKATGLRPIS